MSHQDSDIEIVWEELGPPNWLNRTVSQFIAVQDTIEKLVNDVSIALAEDKDCVMEFVNIDKVRFGSLPKKSFPSENNRDIRDYLVKRRK